MEWLVLVLAGGAAAYAGWGFRVLREGRRAGAAELEGVRRLVEEDVTVLGEQLQRLDAELAGAELDTEARHHFQRALDAYERAKRDAESLSAPDRVGALIDTLASGRYAMACVRTEVARLEVPEPRLACFFNPQHGPSVLDVEWAPPTRGTRTLPACRQCAARVRSRGVPELRTVRIGVRRVPYWDAPAALQPDRADRQLPALSASGPSVSWLLDTAMSGDTDLGHYTDGHPISA